jgi:hypothetical protein
VIHQLTHGQGPAPFALKKIGQAKLSAPAWRVGIKNWDIQMRMAVVSAMTEENEREGEI